MNRIRVLIVDDSSTIRMILTKLLNGDPGLEVAGTAANGRLALARIARDRPDVVVIDVEMPEMDGLETLHLIRQSDPDLPVIMFSRLTERGVRATVDALLLGANDYVTKPESGADVERSIHDELIPKIKAFAGRRPRTAFPGDARPLVAERREPPGLPDAPHRSAPGPVRQTCSVLAIAASTGGPSVLADLLASIAADCRVPVLIVQHMPPGFTGALAGRLATRSGLNVREAAAEQPLAGAQVWVAPGDHHMLVSQRNRKPWVGTNRDAAENSCRPSADVLFRSVAAVYGRDVLAVVLTGMGQDALAGCRAVRDAGGAVLVQDEPSSVVWGMPGNVARAGLADAVLEPSELGREIIRRMKGSG